MRHYQDFVAIPSVLPHHNFKRCLTNPSPSNLLKMSSLAPKHFALISLARIALAKGSTETLWLEAIAITRAKFYFPISSIFDAKVGSKLKL